MRHTTTRMKQLVSWKYQLFFFSKVENSYWIEYTLYLFSIKIFIYDNISTTFTCPESLQILFLFLEKFNSLRPLVHIVKAPRSTSGKECKNKKCTLKVDGCLLKGIQANAKKGASNGLRSLWEIRVLLSGLQILQGEKKKR